MYVYVVGCDGIHIDRYTDILEENDKRKKNGSADR